MRKKHLKAQLDNAHRYIQSQTDTIDVLRHELVELTDHIGRLNAQIGLLRAKIDEAQADSQTAYAFIREGYRSKTGETL